MIVHLKLNTLATLLFALFFCFPVEIDATAASDNFYAEQLDAIDDLVATEIEAGNTPGCVVTIGRSDGIAFQRAYGNRQTKPVVEPMTTDTVFDMASVTKPTADCHEHHVALGTWLDSPGRSGRKTHS